MDAAADGTFVNRAVAYGVDDPYGRSRGAVFFDANNDGWADLFVSNYYPRTDGLPTPNRFFQNQAGTSFSSAPEYGLDQTVGGLAQAPGCQDAGDYDGDGYTDLLVCGKAGIHVYHNNGGSSFTDVTASLGLSGVWRDGEWVDFNSDGKLDLRHHQPQVVQIRLQQPDGRFNVVSIKPAADRGPRAGHRRRQRRRLARPVRAAGRARRPTRCPTRRDDHVPERQRHRSQPGVDPRDVGRKRRQRRRASTTTATAPPTSWSPTAPARWTVRCS